jgi:hypothetical protein
MPLIGLAASIALSLMSYYFHQTMVSVADAWNLPEKTISEIEAKLKENDLSQEDLSKLSQFRAELVFENTGTKLKYFSKEGKERLFKPTSEDIENRKRHIWGKHQNEYAQKSTKRALIFWVLICIFSILLGLFTPINKVKKHHLTTG